MSQKSLSVKSKIHKKILSNLNNKEISRIFKEFKNSLDIKNNFAVAVSGGADSLSLAFLSKCYALKNNVKVKCFVVDHKLRKESTAEAKLVINTLSLAIHQMTMVNLTK